MHNQDSFEYPFDMPFYVGNCVVLLNSAEFSGIPTRDLGSVGFITIIKSNVCKVVLENGNSWWVAFSQIRRACLDDLQEDAEDKSYD